MREKEIWKSIKGYEDAYEISSHGNVRSLDRYVDHLDGGFALKKGKELVIDIGKSGYCRVRLYLGGKSKHILVHRLVGIHYIPNPENKPEINHKFGDKGNYYYKDLEWSTRKENMIHAYSNGFKFGMKGETHGQSKITEDDARWCHLWKIVGYSQTEIAECLGITKQNVSKIQIGTRWKHIFNKPKGEKLSVKI